MLYPMNRLAKRFARLLPMRGERVQTAQGATLGLPRIDAFGSLSPLDAVVPVRAGEAVDVREAVLQLVYAKTSPRGLNAVPP